MHSSRGQPAFFPDSRINLVPKYMASFPLIIFLEWPSLNSWVWIEFLISSFLQHPSLGECLFSDRGIEVVHSEMLHRNGSCVCSGVCSFEFGCKQIFPKNQDKSTDVISQLSSCPRTPEKEPSQTWLQYGICEMTAVFRSHSCSFAGGILTP